MPDNTVMKLRILIPVLALLTFISFAHAGVVIGGTRFVYPEKQHSITVSVRNKSTLPWLVSAKIYAGGNWPGATSAPRRPRRLLQRPRFLHYRADAKIASGFFVPMRGCLLTVKRFSPSASQPFQPVRPAATTCKWPYVQALKCSIALRD